MPAFADYSGTASPGSAAGGKGAPNDGQFLSLPKLKRQYTDYLDNKRAEIDEQIQARRYRHGAQYTADQINILRDRRQPVVTFNRVARKIDGIIGIVERMRKDAKAHPRTPKQEQGAELGTAALRYALEVGEWKEKSPICSGDAATDGLAGIELIIVPGDNGDYEVDHEIVNPDTFFYDPRSFKPDFSDARYMGVGKWMDVDAAKDLFPDQADDIEATMEGGADLTSNKDSENRWIQIGTRRVRIVEHWYIHKGEWHYAIYTGSKILKEGIGYFRDNKKKTFCKYVMFSAMVDHDGDRYGFVRLMKSAQDEINSRRSKGLHLLNSRTLIIEDGATTDVEKLRKEAARSDGVIVVNPGMKAEFDDTGRMANLEGQLRFLEEAKNEIENFGPNIALVGQGLEKSSGRAINLLQQAGIAELGPFILAHRGWKLRVYRAMWNAIQQFWTGERWIRVTDNDELGEFIKINGVGIDPNTGMPAMVNALGSLDVDIILDEGPDVINVMQEAYETLIAAQQGGQQVPLELLIDVMPLDAGLKKKWLDKLQEPKPGDQIQMEGAQAEVEETKSSARLKEAQAIKALADAQKAQMPEPAQAPPPGPSAVDEYKTMAEAEAAQARARLTDAQTYKTEQEAYLEPFKMEQQHELARQKAQQRPAAQ